MLPCRIQQHLIRRSSLCRLRSRLISVLSVISILVGIRLALLISTLLLPIILLSVLLAVSLLPVFCLLLLGAFGLLLAVVSRFNALLLAALVSVVSLFIAGLSGPLRFCAIAVVGFVLLPIIAVYLGLMAMGIGVATLSAYGFGRTPAALRFSVRLIFRSFAQSFG